MKKVEQTSLIDGPKDRPGDCLRAAWASVLETDAEDLPRWDGNNRWMIYWRNFNVFFLLNGYELQKASYAEPLEFQTPFDSFTAVGSSPRTDRAKHVVVYDWDGFQWDPYPNASGLDSEPDFFEWLTEIEFEIQKTDKQSWGNPPYDPRLS